MYITSPQHLDGGFRSGFACGCCLHSFSCGTRKVTSAEGHHRGNSCCFNGEAGAELLCCKPRPVLPVLRPFGSFQEFAQHPPRHNWLLVPSETLSPTSPISDQHQTMIYHYMAGVLINMSCIYLYVHNIHTALHTHNM